MDDRLTRGGPSAVAPGGGSWNLNFNSDGRKALSVNANGNVNWSDAGGWSRSLNLSINIEPLPVLTISTGPSYSVSHNVAQYVRTVTDATAEGTYGHRYVFAAIDQTQLVMQTRASVILSPRMSFQRYMQPLLAVGDYGQFKELARPRTFDFLEYGTGGSPLYRTGPVRSCRSRRRRRIGSRNSGFTHERPFGTSGSSIRSRARSRSCASSRRAGRSYSPVRTSHACTASRLRHSSWISHSSGKKSHHPVRRPEARPLPSIPHPHRDAVHPRHQRRPHERVGLTTQPAQQLDLDQVDRDLAHLLPSPVR
jgi:hypothetical protein